MAAVLVGIFVQLIGHWASPLAAGSSFLHAIYFVIIGRFVWTPSSLALSQGYNMQIAHIISSGMNIPQVALFGFTFLKYCSAFVEQVRNSSPPFKHATDMLICLFFFLQICATILTFVQAAMMITWSQWEYGEVHNITCVASLLILLHVSVHYYKINFLQTLVSRRSSTRACFHSFFLKGGVLLHLPRLPGSMAAV